MNKHETMFEALENAVDTLREIEDTLLASKLSINQERVFKLRRSLQAAQNEYLKQGDKLKITKPFVIKCVECAATQMREEDYYLHLRQKHGYPDKDAASESNNPRTDYEQGLQQLRSLLAEYTETLLEDD